MVPGEHAKFINSVEEIMSIEELKAWTGPNKKFPAKRWVQAAWLVINVFFVIIWSFLGVLVLKYCQLFLKSNELGGKNCTR